jgi:hypothetical protein
MARPSPAKGPADASRHTGLPLACEELTVNSQPLGPATVNESWIRPRLIGDGDSPFPA